MAADRSRAMPRVDAVWNHPLYQERYRALQRAERDRVFCGHDLQHFLDVARIAWTVLLERAVGDATAKAMRDGRDGGGAASYPEAARDVVYAAALLHDMGRADEYETGEPHDVAGTRIAAEILGTVEQDKRFSSSECERILAAIAHHRTGAAPAFGASGPDALADALRYADKAARACYACSARELCNWPDGKKNLTITW